MDFDSIIRFVAVVDKGSFAAAAPGLNITPQAIATSIAKLEESMGLVLFDRERGGITRPTQLGMAFLPHARFLIAAKQRAVEEVQAVRDARSGWVRIGIGQGMAGATAARAIAALRREVPDAQIVIVEGYMHSLLERLDHGELDLIAGAPDNSRSRRSDLKQMHLFVAQEVVVARRQHPLAAKRSVSLADMREFTWMLPYARRDSHEAMVNAYAEADLEPPEHVIFSDAATVGLELLANEDYLLLVTPDLIWPRLGEPHSPFVALQASRPTIKRHACLMYRTDIPLGAMAARLRDKFVEQVAQRKGARVARGTPKPKASRRRR